MDKKVKKVDGPKFNPEQSYSWKGDDVFPLTGAALQLLYNGLSAKFTDPKAQEIIRDYQMLQVVQGILAQQVELGVILPMENKEV